MAAHLPVNSGILIQQLLLVLFSALVVTVFGGWRKSGFDKPIRLSALLLAFPPLLAPIIMIFITGIIVHDPLQILMLVVFTAVVGFAEEALCRGVMLGAFLPRGPMHAALISSLIFGSMHLINLFYGGDVFIALLTVPF